MLSLRCTDQEQKKFATRAKKFGGPTVVMRELILAFIDDRVKIEPPANKESLYVARSQD